MKNKVFKRIIVGAISFSLVINLAFLCSCNSSKNYDEEIANLQKQIDELKEQNDALRAKVLLLSSGETDRQGEANA